MLFIFESWTLVYQINGKLEQVSCFSLWHLHIAIEAFSLSADVVASGGFAHLDFRARVIPARQQ